ncbi:MFS transporter [Nocardia lijiangensis]|uniref:MFS transporter n=1 Tax=Nocardia lijiangensis TaxID=299618 RepID=UPI00082AB358|nr:MFS transporter [Nocardia lijiangensis]
MNGTAGPVTGIVLAGATLRAPLTCVGPLVPVITHDTGLSAAAAGLLTALPLLVFAAVPAVVLHTVHRGAEQLVRLAMAALLLGIVLRSMPGSSGLFAGTVVIAAAIGYANVLLPAIVRGGVPAARIMTVTAGYVAAMTAAAAVSSGIAVPLAENLPGGWRSALAAGTLLVVPALLVWPIAESGPKPPRAEPRASMPWGSALAWQVSVFMGLQALGFYTTLAWLPSVLHDNGTSPRAAGFALFTIQILGLAAINAMPWLARTISARRRLAVVASAVEATGFLLLALAPDLAPLAIGMLGIGSGACLASAMAFQSERATDVGRATALAAMAQTVGFVLAALGPALLGLLRDHTHNWVPALLTLTAATVLQALMAVGAGRPETVRH